MQSGYCRSSETNKCTLEWLLTNSPLLRSCNEKLLNLLRISTPKSSNLNDFASNLALRTSMLACSCWKKPALFRISSMNMSQAWKLWNLWWIFTWPSPPTLTRIGEHAYCVKCVVNSKGNRQVCPTLRLLIRSGHVTVYEWRTGCAPSTVGESDDYLPKMIELEKKELEAKEVEALNEDQEIDVSFLK